MRELFRVAEDQASRSAAHILWAGSRSLCGAANDRPRICAAVDYACRLRPQAPSIVFIDEIDAVGTKRCGSTLSTMSTLSTLYP